MAKVGVIGIGYVGLTQAIGMVQLGHSVIAYDTDTNKIENLKAGRPPFYEPDLEAGLMKSLGSEKIYFTNDVNDLAQAQYVFLCLPTPQGDNGSADISYLLTAVETVAQLLISSTHLIIKSTVPVNSWKLVRDKLKRNDLSVISNPEFLREGSAFFDFHNPDRVVIGAESHKLAKKIAGLYKGISTEFVLTDNSSAELIKYASNAFLAIKLSYVNDIAAFSEKIGANSLHVLRGIGLDHRIGDAFLNPGPGWGGSCFPKDIQALQRFSQEENFNMPLLHAAEISNKNAQDRVVIKLQNAFPTFDQLVVAVLGITFKANTDDTRNSPAVAVIDKLQKLGVKVKCFDPAVKNSDQFDVYEDPLDVFKESSAIVILTEWDMFSKLDPIEIKGIVKEKNILDTRNIIPKQKWEEEGFIFL